MIEYYYNVQNKTISERDCCRHITGVYGFNGPFEKPKPNKSIEYLTIKTNLGVKTIGWSKNTEDTIGNLVKTISNLYD